jgi:hypothetical protein
MRCEDCGREASDGVWPTFKMTVLIEPEPGRWGPKKLIKHTQMVLCPGCFESYVSTNQSERSEKGD